MKTDVLSTRQVAQLLGVGEATVKRWADAGEIDCFRTPGGHRKFRLRDVTAFVHKRHYEVAETLPGNQKMLGVFHDCPMTRGEFLELIKSRGPAL